MSFPCLSCSLVDAFVSLSFADCRFFVLAHFDFISPVLFGAFITVPHICATRCQRIGRAWPMKLAASFLFIFIFFANWMLLFKPISRVNDYWPRHHTPFAMIFEWNFFMQIHPQFCHLSLAGYEIFRNFCCEKFPVFLHFTYALLSFGGVRWVSRPIGINYYYGLVFCFALRISAAFIFNARRTCCNAFHKLRLAPGCGEMNSYEVLGLASQSWFSKGCLTLYI